MNENQLFGEIRSAVANRMWTSDVVSFANYMWEGWELLGEQYHPYIQQCWEQIPDHVRIITRDMLNVESINSIMSGQSKLTEFFTIWTRHLDLNQWTVEELDTIRQLLMNPLPFYINGPEIFEIYSALFDYKVDDALYYYGVQVRNIKMLTPNAEKISLWENESRSSVAPYEQFTYIHDKIWTSIVELNDLCHFRLTSSQIEQLAPRFCRYNGRQSSVASNDEYYYYNVYYEDMTGFYSIGGKREEEKTIEITDTLIGPIDDFLEKVLIFAKALDREDRYNKITIKLSAMKNENLALMNSSFIKNLLNRRDLNFFEYDPKVEVTWL